MFYSPIVRISSFQITSILGCWGKEMRILWSPPYFSYLVPTWCSSFLQFFFSAKHVKRRDCFFFFFGGGYLKDQFGTIDYGWAKLTHFHLKSFRSNTFTLEFEEQNTSCSWSYALSIGTCFFLSWHVPLSVHMFHSTITPYIIIKFWSLFNPTDS